MDHAGSIGCGSSGLPHLSDSESRIAAHCIAHVSHQVQGVVSSQFDLLRRDIVRDVMIGISGCVTEAVDRALAQRLAMNSSPGESPGLSEQSATVSSSTAASGDSPESSVGAWLCPFCDFPCKDEHSFNEHLRLLLSKMHVQATQHRRVVRRSEHVKRHYCVFDPSDHQHRVLVAGWLNDQCDQSAEYDSASAMISSLRSILTPGARAVFGNGTGNLSKVRDFIDACRRGERPQHE